MNEKISRETRQGLIERARKMRANPTKAEVMLWHCIRRKQVCNLKFRRQHIIHAYIVDFYLPDVRLVIEVDGPVHKSSKEYDQEREAILQALGYSVLRFSNRQVVEEIESVIREIEEFILGL